MGDLDTELNEALKELKSLQRKNSTLFKRRLQTQMGTSEYRELGTAQARLRGSILTQRSRIEDTRRRLNFAHRKFNRAAAGERAEVLTKIRTPRFLSKADDAIARAKAELDALGYDLAALKHESMDPDELLRLLSTANGQGIGIELTPVRQRIFDNMQKELKHLGEWDIRKGTQLKQLLGATDELLLQDADLRHITFQFSADKRAYANELLNTIAVKKNERFHVLTHEFGHHLQYRNFQFNNRTVRWQTARTKNDVLSTIYKGTKERGKKDKFYDHYVGKVYWDGFQEGTSMGLQTFVDRRSWSKIVRKDPDHMYLMWAMLRGY